MEIIRLNIVSPRFATDAAARQGLEQATEITPARSISTAEARPDALRSALRAVPEVDLDRVAALRQALQDGALDSSAEALASDMLAFHRGTQY